MTDAHSSSALILGGSGRTGSLLAAQLIDRGMAAYTASRHASEIWFDWDDPASYGPAIEPIDRVYLVTPVMRVRYVGQVAAFLDQAEAAGVDHVTLLSTYNGDRAPNEVDIAKVEAEVARRQAFTHTILRPAWVMQNFIDEHLPIRHGKVTVPSRGGAEAFVDALDIAAVAAETLLQPENHASATYALTGPEAITFDDVAAIIGTVSGRAVTYQDIDQEAWIDAAISTGVPADYAPMLRWLSGAIINGDGSTPSSDIEAVIGRPPTSFHAFAERHATAWAREE